MTHELGEIEVGKPIAKRRPGRLAVIESRERERWRAMWTDAGCDSRAQFIRRVDRELTRIAVREGRESRTLGNQAFHRIELGEVTPKGDVLIALARAARTPVGCILGLAYKPDDVTDIPRDITGLDRLVEAAARVHRSERPGPLEFTAFSDALEDSCVGTIRDIAFSIGAASAEAEYQRHGDGPIVARARAFALEFAVRVGHIREALPRALRRACAPLPRGPIAAASARNLRAIASASARFLEAPGEREDLVPSAWWPSFCTLVTAARSSWLIESDASLLAASTELLACGELDVSGILP